MGVRHYGIDVVALTGLDKAAAAIQGDGKPAQGQAAGQGGQRGNRGPSPVETARATTSQLSDDISAIGTLLADESVSIAPETSGRLAKVLFEDGATVPAGTPLFQLDTDLATAALEEAKARLELAEANFDRNQTLRKSGNVAQSTFESAQTERDVALTAVDSAQVLLKKLTILAPFPGTLGFRSVSEGAYRHGGHAARPARQDRPVEGELLGARTAAVADRRAARQSKSGRMHCRVKASRPSSPRSIRRSTSMAAPCR